jgi:hypothetical protein
VPSIVWTSINGQVQDILRTKRQERLETERQDRLARREKEFSKIWDGFAGTVACGDRRTLPGFMDARGLPSIAKALADDRTELTKDKWEAMLSTVWQEIEEHG